MIKAIIVRPCEMSGHIFNFGRDNYGNIHLPYRARSKGNFFAKYPVNRRTLIHIWQHLHHNASHAPEAVSKRWCAAARRFERHHLAAGGKGTCRFLNKYTAHAWM